jgi:hypothetical protein
MSKIGIIFKTEDPMAPKNYEINIILTIDEADLPNYETIMEEILSELTEYEEEDFDKWERLESKLKESGIQYEIVRNLQEEYRFHQV